MERIGLGAIIVALIIALVAAVAGLVQVRGQEPERGCFRLEPGDVEKAPHGYIVLSLNAFIVHELAEPSGDDDYWICANGAGGATFYAPRDPAEDEPE